MLGSTLNSQLEMKQGDLVRHNNMSFFPTKEDAQQSLAEIVYKRFEEVSQ